MQIAIGQMVRATSEQIDNHLTRRFLILRLMVHKAFILLINHHKPFDHFIEMHHSSVKKFTAALDFEPFSVPYSSIFGYISF